MKKIILTDQQMIDLAHMLNVAVKVLGVECVVMTAPIVQAIESAESFEPESPPKKARKKKESKGDK